jgi:hypothetical protein
MAFYYDREGNEIKLMRWAELLEDNSYRVVMNDVINGIAVSTVWLGLDHSFNQSDAPIIFETMIFGGPRDEQQWRFSTEEQAIAKHQSIVTKLANENYRDVSLEDDE